MRVHPRARRETARSGASSRRPSWIRRREQRRRRHDAGADPGLEVALDPSGHRLAAPVGVEPLRSSSSRRAAPTGADPRADPGLRTADLVHLPEDGPAARGLGGARGRPTRAMAGAHREVPEHPAQPRARQARALRGAVRALEVGVLDHHRGRRRPRDVVFARRWDRRRGELAQADAESTAARPSKIRFAPGSSLGTCRLVAPLDDTVGADDHQRALRKPPG